METKTELDGADGSGSTPKITKEAVVDRVVDSSSPNEVASKSVLYPAKPDIIVIMDFLITTSAYLYTDQTISSLSGTALVEILLLELNL